MGHIIQLIIQGNFSSDLGSIFRPEKNHCSFLDECQIRRQIGRLDNRYEYRIGPSMRDSYLTDIQSRKCQCRLECHRKYLTKSLTQIFDYIFVLIIFIRQSRFIIWLRLLGIGQGRERNIDFITFSAI